MTEVDQLRAEIATMRQEQTEAAANTKIDSAWSRLAGDTPIAVQRLARLEIAPIASRELMDQSSVDSYLGEFLKTPDIAALIQPAAQPSLAPNSAAPATGKKQKRNLTELLSAAPNSAAPAATKGKKRDLKTMLGDFESGNAKVNLGRF